jgi:transposase-like protein
VDKKGNTIEFLLSAKRDISAAKRFFKKMMKADHRRLPFSISVDSNGEAHFDVSPGDGEVYVKWFDEI